MKSFLAAMVIAAAPQLAAARLQTPPVLPVSAHAGASRAEQIRREKFGGDYDEMVEWWREQKPAEHRKLELEESR